MSEKTHITTQVEKQQIGQSLYDATEFTRDGSIPDEQLVLYGDDVNSDSAYSLNPFTGKQEVLETHHDGPNQSSKSYVQSKANKRKNEIPFDVLHLTAFYENNGDGRVARAQVSYRAKDVILSKDSSTENVSMGHGSKDVEVTRVAINGKTGLKESGAVDKLTGARAERAKDVLAKKAADASGRIAAKHAALSSMDNGQGPIHS